jgi:hypothetical protein
MNASDYKAWWGIHVRVARGERLTAAEQAAYEAGARRLDEAEVIQGDISRLRQTRAAAAAAEAECASLRLRRDDLDRQIAVLEATLSARARSLLGVAE